MKTLNRPMFKYGGPIKEGVMNGIREPKKNGGLSKQFNTGLVGDERYPKTDGREHHYLFLPAMGMAALRALAPRAIAAGAKSFGRGLATSPGKGTTAFGKGLTKMERLKNLLPSGRFRNIETPTMSKGASFQYKPAPLSIKESLRSPEIIGRAIRENPFTAFGVAGQVKNIPDIAGGIFDVGKSAVQGGTNYLLGTEFGKNKLPEKDINKDPNLGKTTKELGKTTSTNTNPDGSPVVQLTDKEKRSQQIQKYRDIMDIKSMNKGAAYDSLIAASQAVNQSGDFKGDLKSGKLINQIIQSTSKAFDKPAKTKDAIDSLILKAEIEKDIKASDPSNEILNRLREVQIKKGLKDIEGGDFAENVAIATKSGASGQSIFDQAAGLTVDDFRGNLITKTDMDKVIKKAKESGEMDEQEIVVSYTNTIIEGKEVPDGNYTVGKNLITIQDGKVFDIK
tara:strand:+ start:643 stop:1995 length:1353 start_codon:yes stop_codon:yes gene_type:complete